VKSELPKHISLHFPDLVEEFSRAYRKERARVDVAYSVMNTKLNMLEKLEMAYKRMHDQEAGDEKVVMQWLGYNMHTVLFKQRRKRKKRAYDEADGYDYRQVWSQFWTQMLETLNTWQWGGVWGDGCYYEGVLDRYDETVEIVQSTVRDCVSAMAMRQFIKSMPDDSETPYVVGLDDIGEVSIVKPDFRVQSHIVHYDHEEHARSTITVTGHMETRTFEYDARTKQWKVGFRGEMADDIFLLKMYLPYIQKRLATLKKDSTRARLDEFFRCVVQMECRTQDGDGGTSIDDVDHIHAMLGITKFQMKKPPAFRSNDVYPKDIEVVDPGMLLEIEEVFAQLLVQIDAAGLPDTEYRDRVSVVFFCMGKIIERMGHMVIRQRKLPHSGGNVIESTEISVDYQIMTFIFPPAIVDHIVDKNQTRDHIDSKPCPAKYVEMLKVLLGVSGHEPLLDLRLVENEPLSFLYCLRNSFGELYNGTSDLREMIHLAVVRFQLSRHAEEQRRCNDPNMEDPEVPKYVREFVHRKRTMDQIQNKMRTLKTEVITIKIDQIKSVVDIDAIWNNSCIGSLCNADSTTKYEIIRCTSGNCMGFVSTMLHPGGTGTCSVCETTYCSSCWKAMSSPDHVCADRDLDTVQAVKDSCRSTQCLRCRTIHHRDQGCDELFCLFCKTGFNFQSGQAIENSDSPDWKEYVMEDKLPIPWICPNQDWQAYDDSWAKIKQIRDQNIPDGDEMDFVGHVLHAACVKMRQIWRNCFDLGSSYPKELYVQQKKHLLKIVLRTLCTDHPTEKRYVQMIGEDDGCMAQPIKFLHVLAVIFDMRTRISEQIIAMAFERTLFDFNKVDTLLKEFHDVCKTYEMEYEDLQ
jgi:hypothetical protein